MGKLIDLSGRRFGRLFVVRRGSNSRQGKPRWVCVCDCGNETLVHGVSLRSGCTTSCDCLRRERCARRAADMHSTHGQSRTATYRSWSSMRTRCNNPNATGYERYGGAGVTVCARWDDFELFLMDMGERPDGTTLDRIDPYGDYEPDNCRWATPLEQRHNWRVDQSLRS